MWPFKNKTVQSRDKPVAQVRYTPVRRMRADNTMRGSEAIFSAVSRISNTMASLPLHLYKGHDLMADHPLEKLLAQAPNPSLSSFSFLQTMEVCRNTEGNAYALLLPDKMGVVRQLDILDPTRVRPQRHPQTKEMWYVITMDDGLSYPLPGHQLLVLRHPSANGEIGIRPIDVLAGTLDYDKNVKEFSLNQLDGVNQGIFLTVPSSGLGKTETENVINRFLDAYEKSGQRVVVLEGGLTATTFSQSPINAQVMDVERITRNRVATVYNIPPHMLGDYSGGGYGSSEQLMREYLQLTILPIATQWEQELNRKLLSQSENAQGYSFRFDLDELSRADTATMAEKHQKAIRGGWMTPNEAREREGLSPDKNGDELMASRDLLPLRIAVETPELLLGTRERGEGG